ncbi:hypothetical protein L1987_77049 [Smallanthus sonchifolius]|uniref:Uncharacterized protein n=1 Tax=Smallanthus sonchifolius TaxID=185202 RepID=A0ACB8ZDA9_9ASTR|nr:hypothetical protein L1987_77049 [Smallanthus sonchifolius]
MGSYSAAFEYCYYYLVQPLYESSISVSCLNLTNFDFMSAEQFCRDIADCEYNSENEGKYSQPMVLIGIYISIASLFCILAMALDLLNGFRNKKFWFPTKFFSLNAASITVITVAMKLPVDLSSPMPGGVDQVAKIGGLAFMCTMMSNLMPSLASMEKKSLLVNVTAITIPTSKEILESKYKAASKTTLNDQHPQENLAATTEKLRQLVRKHWIMTETGSPQFTMASNPLSSASGNCSIMQNNRAHSSCGYNLCHVLFILFKALKAMLFTPPTPTSNDDTNEDLSNYVLLLEDNVQLAEKTTKRISDSMNRLIQNAEKKQDNNLMRFLEKSKSVAFDGVVMFDTDQIQSLRPFVEHVNSWSLPIVSLTCIAIALPSIHKDVVDNLLKSVGEGLFYTQIVEESLNKGPEYVNSRKATTIVWHEVEDKCKWLNKTLERIAYEGKTPTEIIKSFARRAEEVVNEFNKSTDGDRVEKENLPLKLIAANSMYRIAQTIMLTYECKSLEIIEEELFTRLSGMIADILAACLTNIPQVITLRCQESAIEKREASVVAAVKLLGRTTKIIKILEEGAPLNMDPYKMGFIEEWRLHLKQP